MTTGQTLDGGTTFVDESPSGDETPRAAMKKMRFPYHTVKIVCALIGSQECAPAAAKETWMVRRTKEEALATRCAIIAAAREVFYHNGVTRSSLEMIAAAAGVTRGAIYWHFADKAALFYAMRDEVKLPLVDRSHQSLTGPDLDHCPLERIERFIVTLFEGLVSDEAVRRTLWIMTFQCEYVGEFARDLVSAREMHAELKAKLVPLYRAAQRSGLLRPDVTATRAAADTVIFVAGLIRVWLLDDDGSLIRRDIPQLIADHVRGKQGVPRQGATAARGVSRGGWK